MKHNWSENTIAFSPFGELTSEAGLKHVTDRYQQMMGIFDNEIAPVVNGRLNLAFEGEDKGRDIIKEAVKTLVEMDMVQDTLHNYLSYYNDFLRSVDAYAEENDLGGLFAANGFESRRLYQYWYPYYTRNLRSGKEPYFRARQVIQTLSVSFVIANEVMGICRYAAGIWDVLKFAYRGSKRLQFTWADYFNYLYATHSSVATTIVYNVISMMLKGGRNKTSTCPLTKVECVGVAFAQYAYGRKAGVTPNVVIIPLKHIEDADLAGVYNSETMYLELENAFGLQVAAFEHDGRDCVAFAGTRLDFTGVGKSIVSMQNILTDVIQIAYKPTPAYMAAVGIVDAMIGTGKEVNVYGHSLGGGLMQFACAANSTTKVHGYGYNAAGLSAATCDMLSNHGSYVPLDNIVFVNAAADVVSKIGFFLGKRKVVDTTEKDMLKAHRIETLNKALNKPEVYC